MAAEWVLVTATISFMAVSNPGAVVMQMSTPTYLPGFKEEADCRKFAKELTSIPLPASGTARLPIIISTCAIRP